MLQLAFYKGSGNWFDKITRWRTAGDFTHVELVFSDGVSFSSSQWDGGTRFKDIVYTDKEKWVMVRVPGVNEVLIRKWCETQVGKKYDWKGLLKLMASGNAADKNPEDWYCSNICRAACTIEGIFVWLRPGCDPDQLYIAARAREEGILGS